MLLPELAALDDYRLEHGWSWAALSAAMKKNGIVMSPRTLYHICRRAHEDATVRDITLLKVSRFIALNKIPVIKRRTAKKRPAAKVALYV